MHLIYKRILFFLGVFSFFLMGTLSVQAAMVVSVSDDGYLPAGMGNWYWDREYAKSYNQFFGAYDAYGFAKFDLSALGTWQGDDIASAELNLYVTDRQGAGPAAYAQGVTSTFVTRAYDDTLLLGQGYVGSGRPGYVAGTDVLTDYTGGPGGWVSIDVTQMVRGWLDGTYANNGMEIYDGVSDDYGLYWAAVESTDQSLRPYIAVNTVPLPGAVYLLGLGLAALAGIRGKKRA